jgi:hypothetical protein
MEARKKESHDKFLQIRYFWQKMVASNKKVDWHDWHNGISCKVDMSRKERLKILKRSEEEEEEEGDL